MFITKDREALHLNYYDVTIVSRKAKANAEALSPR